MSSSSTLKPKSLISPAMRESMHRNALMGVSFLLSLIYFYKPGPFTKVFPISALVIFAASEVKERGQYINDTKRRFIPALILSGIGDIFLEVDENNTLYFMLGLVSFLVSHVLYIRTFYFTEVLQCIPIGWMGFLIVYYLFMMVYLLPSAPLMLTVPIMIYGAVLASLLGATIARCYAGQFNKQSKRLALFGAMIFVVSDSILAINKFSFPIPMAKTLIMVTYYTAQTLLTMSSDFDLLRGHAKKKF
jgi:uncharacterized membrane protein YhhN